MRHFPAILFALVCAAIVAMSCWGKPDNTPKEKKKDESPNLNYESNWGKMTVEVVKGKRMIAVSGHVHWNATGEVREVNGKTDVILFWTTTDDTPRHGTGVYSIEADGALKGFWNWDSELKDDGTGGGGLDGLTLSDRVFRLSKE